MHCQMRCASQRDCLLWPPYYTYMQLAQKTTRHRPRRGAQTVIAACLACAKLRRATAHTCSKCRLARKTVRLRRWKLLGSPLSVASWQRKCTLGVITEQLRGQKPVALTLSRSGTAEACERGAPDMHVGNTICAPSPSLCKWEQRPTNELWCRVQVQTTLPQVLPWCCAHTLAPQCMITYARASSTVLCASMACCMSQPCSCLTLLQQQLTCAVLMRTLVHVNED